MDTGNPPKAFNPKEISREFDLMKILWGILATLSGLVVALGRFNKYYSENATKVLTTIIPFIGFRGLWLPLQSIYHDWADLILAEFLLNFGTCLMINSISVGYVPPSRHITGLRHLARPRRDATRPDLARDNARFITGRKTDYTRFTCRPRRFRQQEEQRDGRSDDGADRQFRARGDRAAEVVCVLAWSILGAEKPSTLGRVKATTFRHARVGRRATTRRHRLEVSEDQGHWRRQGLRSRT